MALLEALKANALASVQGNAGALQSSEYVTWNSLRQLLFELFGAGQSGITLPAGFIGSTFPGGDTVTGTLAMYRVVDAASLSSPAGATPSLKSFAVPAATPAVLGTGGIRGLEFFSAGSFANNANAKTVTVAFGGGSAMTVAVATASQAALWACHGYVLVRSSSSVIMGTFGAQSTAAGGGTPTATGGDVAVTGLTLTSAQTLQFAGTQTSAADIVQDLLVVKYIA